MKIKLKNILISSDGSFSFNNTNTLKYKFCVFLENKTKLKKKKTIQSSNIQNKFKFKTQLF